MNKPDSTIDQTNVVPDTQDQASKKPDNTVKIAYFAVFSMIGMLGFFLPCVTMFDTPISPFRLLAKLPGLVEITMPIAMILLGVVVFNVKFHRYFFAQLGGAFAALCLLTLLVNASDPLYRPGLWVPMVACIMIAITPLLASVYHKSNPGKPLPLPKWAHLLWTLASIALIVFTVYASASSFISNSVLSTSDFSTPALSEEVETPDLPQPEEPVFEEFASPDMEDSAETIVEDASITAAPTESVSTPSNALDAFLGNWFIADYNIDVSLTQTDEGAYYLYAISVDSQMRISDAEAILSVDESNQVATGYYDSDSWGNAGMILLEYSSGVPVLTIQVTASGNMGGDGLNISRQVCTAVGIETSTDTITLKSSPDQITDAVFYLNLVSQNGFDSYFAYETDLEWIGRCSSEIYGTWNGSGLISSLTIDETQLNERPYAMELFGYTQSQFMSYIIYGQYLDGAGETFILFYSYNEFGISLTYYDLAQGNSWVFAKL